MTATPPLATPSSGKKKQAENHAVLDCVIHAIKKMPSLAERVKVAPDKIEALYFLGFQLYEMQCYEQASDLFRLLCFYQPQSARNWIALGGSYQHIKSHYNALASFAMASIQEPLNPEPKLYAAHSLIDLQDLPLALECAETAILLSSNKPKKQNLFLRATALRNAIAAQIKLN